MGHHRARRAVRWLTAGALLLALTVGVVAQSPDAEHAKRLLSALADDSMEGRLAGSPGAARAARLIASEMTSLHLEPKGDSGYFQRVPIRQVRGAQGSADDLELLPSLDSLQAVPAAQRRMGVNVIGLLRGSDPALRDQIVLVDAHYDHLGIGAPVAGDSIYNGADDDASGTVAVLEIARALAKGAPIKRSVLFVTTTGEEEGLLGTRWLIAHPPVPITSIASNMEIEMIGRPDSLAGGRGRAWLTGYDRSTMGELLRQQGITIVADPRPNEHFFERSDNIAFALRGIPAHTLSSFNLHADYHQPSDDVSRVDFPHMAMVIDAAARAVRMLADGASPRWNPGGRPTRR